MPSIYTACPRMTLLLPTETWRNNGSGRAAHICIVIKLSPSLIRIPFCLSLSFSLSLSLRVHDIPGAAKSRISCSSSSTWLTDWLTDWRTTADTRNHCGYVVVPRSRRHWRGCFWKKKKKTACKLACCMLHVQIRVAIRPMLPQFILLTLSLYCAAPFIRKVGPLCCGNPAVMLSWTERVKELGGMTMVKHSMNH
jgi:hypothetical protein